MNIVLIGKPGCGKGTLSNYLLNNVKDYNFITISPGDLMKKIMAEENNQDALFLKNLLDKGNFAPDEFTINIIKKEIENIDNSILSNNNNIKPSFIYDGFPRTIAQAQMMAKELPVDLVVYFDIEDKVIIERISNRLIHLPSSRIYNLKTNPPKNPGLDDITGEPLTKRKDDDSKIIQQRIDNFMNLTYPAYQELSKHFSSISVNGNLSPDIIYKEIEKKLKIIPIVNLFLKKETRLKAIDNLKDILLPLDKNEIKFYLKIFFDTLLEEKNMNNYEGKLFYKNEFNINYKNMIYTIKEYIFWNLLYPEIANKYFVDNGNNIVEIKNEKPLPSIVSMEYKKIEKKDNLGFTHYSYEKPKDSHKLKSGWTYEQTKELITYLTVGFFKPLEFDFKKNKQKKIRKIKNIK